MLLDDTDFPIVRMHYDRSGPAGAETPFETYERLLARQQRFVLIGFGADTHEDDQEERKQVSLWMKRNRDALRRFPIALVLVEPRTANHAAIRGRATQHGKFWGYPLLVTVDEASATAIAERLLAGEPATAILPEEPGSASADQARRG